MVALSPPQRLTLSPQVKLAAGAGGLVALAFILMPSGLLERLVLASGIPAVLAAAEPPLGFTARIALGGTLGGLLAAFLWVGLGLLDEDVGVGKAVFARLRRGDRHADAPPRPPLSAQRELGEPAVAPPPPVEQALPVDLDQPLAAFDPAAILAVPLAPPEPLAPLRPQLIDPGDRFEMFEMTPLHRQPAVEPIDPPTRPLSLRVPPPNSLRTTTLRDSTPIRVPAPVPPAPVERVVTAATEGSVQALLARLESGLATPCAPPPPAPAPVPTLRTGRLEHALGDLRKLAVGAG